MITAVVVEKRPASEVAAPYGVSRSRIHKLLARRRPAPPVVMTSSTSATTRPTTSTPSSRRQVPYRLASLRTNTAGMPEALHRHHLDESLEVRAARHRRLWKVQEGLEAVDNWTDMFEPLRVRRVGASRWRDVATMDQVVSRVMEVLEERPDVVTADAHGWGCDAA